MSKTPRVLIGICLVSLYLFTTLGCDPESLRQAHQQPGQVQDSPATSTAPNSIVMGSFNIQTLGQAKLGNADVTNILVDIGRRFDILAIQELRSTRQDVIPRLVSYMNQDGSKFKAIVSPRLGYTISKEQYVIIYDSEKIEYLGPATTGHPTDVQLVGNESIAFDANDTLHRAPMVGHFRCLNVPPDQAFTFALMNIHVDPDEVPTELNALTEIVQRIVANNVEDDIILIGDLNAPPRYFSSFPWFANQHAAIPDHLPTNTRGRENFDNIVFNARNTNEFLGNAGVFNVMQEYQLTLDQALQVSDHLPVWAQFSTREAPRQQIVQDPRVIR